MRGIALLALTLTAAMGCRCRAKEQKRPDAATAQPDVKKQPAPRPPRLIVPNAPALPTAPRAVVDCAALLTVGDIAEACQVDEAELASLPHEREGSGRVLLCARFFGRIGTRRERILLAINAAASTEQSADNRDEGVPPDARVLDFGRRSHFVKRPGSGSPSDSIQRKVFAQLGTSLISLTAQTPNSERKSQLCTDDQLIDLARRVVSRL